MWNTLTPGIMNARWFNCKLCLTRHRFKDVIWLNSQLCLTSYCFKDVMWLNCKLCLTSYWFKDARALNCKLCMASYCFKDKIYNFQVNTNPLLKHTVTLSVVGKSSSSSSVFLKCFKIKSCQKKPSCTSFDYTCFPD